MPADLASDLARALDPVVFAASLGFAADAWQAGVLRSGAKRRLLLCSRQWGKSTTTAILALHRAVYRPGSLILLVSPSLRQSGELFKKVATLLRHVDPAPARIEDNRLSLELANGSRVVSLPGSEATVRGFSGASLIVEDEAARVDDALYEAIRPMVATSDGDLVLLSTPFGQRGHFWDAWANGGDAWERVKVTAHDCPRISAAFIEGERAALGALAFRSEYLVEFCDTIDQVFKHANVMGALSDDVAPLFAREVA